jgi:hypothetical protein
VPNTGVNGDISGNTTSIYADEYEWTLPANRPSWKFAGQPTAIRIFRTTNPNVNVEIDGIQAGDISVRGVVSTCVANNFSRSLLLPINRITPKTNPITASSAIAGQITAMGQIACGVNSIITLATTPIAQANNYQWRFVANQSGWKFIGANGSLLDIINTVSPTVQVQTTPNTTPTFEVKANINYGNGIFEDATVSNPFTITLNTISPILSIDMPFDICTDNISSNTIPITINATGGIMIPDAYTAVSSNPNLLSISPATTPVGNSFLAQVVSGVTGTVLLTFTGKNTCGITTRIHKTINLTSGMPDDLGRLQTSLSTITCLYTPLPFWINPVPNATSYTWTPISTYRRNYTLSIEAIENDAKITLFQYGLHTFEITASNSCGSKSEQYSLFATRSSLPCLVERGQNANSTVFKNSVIYPNPAKDVLSITLPTIFSENLTLSLYNSFGQLKKAIKIDFEKVSDDNTLQLNIDDLPNGMYVLHLIDGKNIQQHQIMIAK